MTHQEMFDKCVNRTVDPDGTVEFRCRLGLWAVSGMREEWVLDQANHYWSQYLLDGEYNNLLKQPEP